MHYRPDWLPVPTALAPMIPLDLGGRWKQKTGLLVHRTLLPLLDPKIAQAILTSTSPVGSPSCAEPNLRPYQRSAVDFARGRDGSILALDCGLGKTRTALYATREGADQVGLIVAPKIAFSVWERELRLVYGPTFEPVRVRGVRLADDPLELSRPGIYLVNPEILHARWSEWLLHRLSWVILDEAHIYTLGRSARSRSAQALANLSGRRVALTGTPVMRHTTDLYGLCSTVAPGALGAWSTFANWLGFKRTGHGWEFGPISPDHQRELDERMSEIMLRVRWHEVSDSVPPIQRERLFVSLSAGEQAEYDLIENDVRNLVDLSHLDLGVLESAAKLVQVNLLRRLVGRAKIPAVVELVASLAEPCVVWAWHRDVARAITSKLGDRAVCITGEDSEKVRRSAVERFQNGGADVLVGTLAVAGVGIDLSRARITVNAEMDYLPSTMTQSEARVWRTGQTKPCITYWPLAAGTIEERIVEILIEKIAHARIDVLPQAAVQDRTDDGASSAASLIDRVMDEEAD